MIGEPEIWAKAAAERARVERICDEVRAQVDREFRLARNDGGLEVVHRWPTPAALAGKPKVRQRH